MLTQHTSKASPIAVQADGQCRLSERRQGDKRGALLGVYNTKPVAEGGSANEDLSDEDSDDEGSDGEGNDCPVLRAGHPIVCHLEGSPY